MEDARFPVIALMGEIATCGTKTPGITSPCGVPLMLATADSVLFAAFRGALAPLDEDPMSAELLAMVICRGAAYTAGGAGCMAIPLFTIGADGALFVTGT